VARWARSAYPSIRMRGLCLRRQRPNHYWRISNVSLSLLSHSFRCLYHTAVIMINHIPVIFLVVNLSLAVRILVTLPCLDSKWGWFDYKSRASTISLRDCKTYQGVVFKASFSRCCCSSWEIGCEYKVEADFGHESALPPVAMSDPRCPAVKIATSIRNALTNSKRSP
jgi:hypothetical protein